MKERIEKWYKLGLWTEQMVMDAVKKSVLTEEQVKEILDKK